MPRTLLLLAGLAMMLAALLSARTEASVLAAPWGVRAAVGDTSAVEAAATKCAHQRVCRPGRGCAWRKVCKRW